MSTLGGLKATASAGPMHVFLFTSEYDFLPEGVMRIKKIFQKRLSLEGLYAKLNYERRTHTFDVVCQALHHDHVMTVFLKIITTMVETEIGDGYAELKSKFIARIVSDTCEVQDMEESDEASEAASEDLGSDRVKFTWQCNTEDLILEKVVPMIAQEQIEFMTGTKLFKDLNRQVIRVDAPSQEAFDRAAHKLDILRKYHVIAYVKVDHIFYTEDREKYEVSIKSFLDIKKKFIETTLLDPLSSKWRYDQLKKAFTVRCCPYEHARNIYVLKTGQKWIPAVPLKAKDAVFDLWVEYMYPCKGEMSLKHCRDEVPRSPAIGPLNKSQIIRTWLTTGSPDNQVENRAQNGEGMPRTERPKFSFAGPIDTGDFQKVAFETAASEREKMKDDITNTSGRKQLAPKNENLPGFNTVHKNGYFLGIPPGQPLAFRTAASRELRKNSLAILENIRGSTDSQSLLDTDILEDERLRLAISDVSSHSVNLRSSPADAVGDHGLNSFINPDCSPSLIDNDILESDRRQLFAAKFLVLEPIKDVEVSHSGDTLPPATPQPTIRRETEVETRRYHETMRQGAPKKDKGKEKAHFSPPSTPKKDKGKGKAPLSPPAPLVAGKPILLISNSEYITKMTACVKLILASMRNWQGEVNIQVQFGRILIRPFHPSVTGTTERPRSHPPEDVHELLCRNPGKVSMTKVISTLPADIQFFLEMKGDTHQPLWEEAMSWTVTYEYICCDHDDYDGKCAPVFIIEMDADSFETKVKSVPLTFGAVYVHCTMRNWDYCVNATGSRNLEEDYGDVVKEIADSTYIPPNQKKVSMSFEISEKYPIHIVAIRVRRHSQYPSFDGQTLLNITEVHNLDVSWQHGDNKTIFFATSSDRKESDAQTVEPMWYEMNITSTEAQEAFKENINLEFGEETEWNENLLLKTGVVMKDMCEPANYLIKKMDGIGYYNNNGHKPVPTDLESFTSTKPPAHEKPGFEYW